ncbi:hypothetical protein GCM10022393_07100 [Aquimarina addita]|uniref:Carboxypeptidase regulatory-like domain-containing protein n=1 Tax=Aquimarina addita TaxID=870485 RepID=A0ABP7XB79_9FLAO
MNTKKLLIVLLLICTSCSVDIDNDEVTTDPVFCTEELRYGLEITVRSAAIDTNAIIIKEGITVVAKDGEYSEKLINITGTDAFIGAAERPGNYFITIRGEGYKTYTSSDPILVESDQCHVLTESLEIILSQ